jgi:hypothetical protein
MPCYEYSESPGFYSSDLEALIEISFDRYLLVSFGSSRLKSFGSSRLKSFGSSRLRSFGSSRLKSFGSSRLKSFGSSLSIFLVSYLLSIESGRNWLLKRESLFSPMVFSCLDSPKFSSASMMVNFFCSFCADLLPNECSKISSAPSYIYFSVNYYFWRDLSCLGDWVLASVENTGL